MIIKTPLPFRLAATVAIGLSVLPGCRNNQAPPAPETQESILQKDNVLLPNIDHVIQKAKKGEIETIYLVSGHDNPVPYYQINLKSGYTQFLLLPSDEKENQRLINELSSIPDKPISISRQNKWTTLGNITSFLPMLSMLPLTLLIIFYVLQQRKVMGAAKRWKPVKPQTRFSDVKGYPKVVERLQNVLKYIRDPERNKVDAPMPKGILLTGPPGTGKTLMAKAIAGEAGIPLIPLSGSEFKDKYVGVSGERIREAFRTAKKNAPCILFIDEIDAIASSRVQSPSHAELEHNSTVNQLLTEMDGFDPREGVMVLAATNNPENLDKALLRPGRIDMTIEIPLPISPAQRMEILDFYLETKREKKQLAPCIDVVSLANKTAGFSGAKLKNVVTLATTLAFENGQDKITEKNLDDAITELRLGMRNDIIINPDDLWKTSVHEVGGHGLIARACNVPIDDIAIEPRGNSLGHVSIATEHINTLLPSKVSLLKQILIAIGGRAAEIELLPKNEFTTGAKQDFQQIREILKMMLTSAMLDGNYVSDYDNPRLRDGQLFRQDEKVVNEIIEKALEVARGIIRRMPKDSLEQMIKDSLEVGELKGKAAEDFFNNHLNGVNWDNIYNTFVTDFIDNPFSISKKL